jgi:hypothetical protein
MMDTEIDVLEEFRKKFETEFRIKKKTKQKISSFRGGYLFKCRVCDITHVYLVGNDGFRKCCGKELFFISAPNYSISFSKK